MHIFYSDRHHAHQGQYEFFRGELVPCFEKPERADMVLAAVQARRIGPVLEPQAFDIARSERGCYRQMEHRRPKRRSCRSHMSSRFSCSTVSSSMRLPMCICCPLWLKYHS